MCTPGATACAKALLLFLGFWLGQNLVAWTGLCHVENKKGSMWDDGSAT